jgi:hypothetical protein
MMFGFAVILLSAVMVYQEWLLQGQRAGVYSMLAYSR